MAPSPGTPVGGERPSRRAAPAPGGGVPMEVDGPPSAAGGPDVAMPAAGRGACSVPCLVAPAAMPRDVLAGRARQLSGDTWTST